jgi:hypothetical protein
VRAQAIANAFADGRHPPLPDPAASGVQLFLPADKLSMCCPAALGTAALFDTLIAP